MLQRTTLAPSFLSWVGACASATTVSLDDQLTIQATIHATIKGDTILVGPGTYTGPGNKGLNFHEIDRVLISEQGPAVTVID